jgi:hypothetical protein
MTETYEGPSNNISLNIIGNYKPLLNEVPEGIKACIMHKGVSPAFSRNMISSGFIATFS